MNHLPSTVLRPPHGPLLPPLPRPLQPALRLSISPTYIHCHLSNSSQQPPSSSDKRRSSLSPLFHRIAAVGSPSTSRTLKQWEDRNSSLTKAQLTSLAHLLRRLGRHGRALDIYEWMSSQPDRFSLSSYELSALLELTSRARGLRHAEHLFSSLPGDYLAHLTLLRAYARSNDSPKTHSFLETLIERGFADRAPPYNAVIEMHLRLGEHDRVLSLFSKMMDSNVPFDETSFKFLIKSCQSSRDAKGIAVVSRLLDAAFPPISSSWSIRALLSVAWSEIGDHRTAAKHAEEAERKIIGKDRSAFESLIRAYSFAGRTDDVFRIWTRYRSDFPTVPDSGYHSMMSALARIGDVDGAESIYREWLGCSSGRKDSRMCNLFLARYAEERTASRAHSCLREMEEVGGTPHPSSWEVVALAYVDEKRTWEALICLRNATYAEVPEKWMPRKDTVERFLYTCAELEDRESYEALHILLKIVIRRHKNVAGMPQLSTEALGKLVDSVRLRSETGSKRGEGG